jgi:hypothetical protein
VRSKRDPLPYTDNPLVVSALSSLPSPSPSLPSSFSPLYTSDAYIALKSAASEKGGEWVRVVEAVGAGEQQPHQAAVTAVRCLNPENAPLLLRWDVCVCVCVYYYYYYYYYYISLCVCVLLYLFVCIIISLFVCVCVIISLCVCVYVCIFFSFCLFIVCPSGMIAMVATYDHHLALRFSRLMECGGLQEIVLIPYLHDFVV